MSHPIEGLLNTTMKNIEHMVDVNTIIGDPIEIPNGGIILTVSKVGFGFAAGGSQFGKDDSSKGFPFGGGSGGGVSITPVAFLIIHNNEVKVMHLEEQTHIVEKMMDLAPEALKKIKEMMVKKDNDGTGADSYESE